MRRAVVLGVIAALLAAGCGRRGAPRPSAAARAAVPGFALRSLAFRAQRDARGTIVSWEIPEEFTVAGEPEPTAWPGIVWRGAPAGTRSFALSVVDKDNGDLVHLLVADIPPDVNEILSHPSGFPVPRGARILPNSFGWALWTPPIGEIAPGAGPPTPHRYVFTLTALGVARLEGLTAENFFGKVDVFGIAETSFTGCHTPRPPAAPPAGPTGAAGES